MSPDEPHEDRPQGAGAGAQAGPDTGASPRRFPAEGIGIAGPKRDRADDAGIAGPGHDPADDVPLGDHCYDWNLPGKPNCPHWHRTGHGTVRCLLTGWEEWQQEHPLYLAAMKERGVRAAHDLWPPPSALADEHKVCGINLHDYWFEDDLVADPPDPDDQVLRPRPAPRWP